MDHSKVHLAPLYLTLPMSGMAIQPEVWGTTEFPNPWSPGWMEVGWEFANRAASNYTYGALQPYSKRGKIPFMYSLLSLNEVVREGSV